MKMVTVLAIGAHPDDIEVGCAGTLAMHKCSGDKVYVLVLSKGEASGDSRAKELACKKSADLLGIDGLFFGGLQDTKISDGIETIQVIEKVVEEVKPDIIYTLSYEDTHQDHRNTAFATFSAARRCKKVLMYEVPKPLKDFYPQVFVDIEKTFEIKKKALLLFGRESERFLLAANAIEGLAILRGFQAGVRFAEAFEVGKFILEV